jgi:MSHA pilin protein MshC
VILQEHIEAGFTLIELVAVILLLSILSVVALSRLGGMDVFEEKAYFDEVTNAFRYAQKLAQSTGCSVQVTTTSTSYKLLQGSDCTSTTYDRNVLNPANRTLAYENLTPPDGVTLSPDSTIVFTPQSTVTGLGGNTPYSAGSYSFTLYTNTGLVDVN